MRKILDTTEGAVRSESAKDSLRYPGCDGDFGLEGLPCTGTSETIANILAHNLGLGRKVLFVSEKMAPLYAEQTSTAGAVA